MKLRFDYILIIHKFIMDKRIYFIIFRQNIALANFIEILYRYTLRLYSTYQIVNVKCPCPQILFI